MDILVPHEGSFDKYIEAIYSTYFVLQENLQGDHTIIETIYFTLCVDFGIVIPEGRIENIELAANTLQEISNDLKTVNLEKMESIDLAYKLYLPFVGCGEEFIELARNCMVNYLKPLKKDCKYVETSEVIEQIDKLKNLERK